MTRRRKPEPPSPNAKPGKSSAFAGLLTFFVIVGVYVPLTLYLESRFHLSMKQAHLPVMLGGLLFVPFQRLSDGIDAIASCLQKHAKPQERAPGNTWQRLPRISCERSPEPYSGVRSSAPSLRCWRR